MRVALPISWLEIRCYRTMRRSAIGARCERLCATHQTEILSARRAGRCALDLYGTARLRAASARVGVLAGAGGPALRVKAPAGVQLASGHGRGNRFEPR